MKWHLDTSAALKLIVEEPESKALADAVDEHDVDLVAGYLLATELRRAALRREELGQADVTAVLEFVSLVEMPDSLFREAGLLPGTNLRSLDALHLACAVRMGVHAVVTYDSRMAEAALGMGLSVKAFGSTIIR
ncbi:MAG TPA: type II toxin-antitoxin system VapC family toxin [Actinomycetales bacterium]|nr:type II toxin-antitoxin system VapC family toxin [Actinomycetales bacterium]